MIRVRLWFSRVTKELFTKSLLKSATESKEQPAAATRKPRGKRAAMNPEVFRLAGMHKAPHCRILQLDAVMQLNTASDPSQAEICVLEFT